MKSTQTESETLKRLWEGIPVEDAKQELRIVLLPCDFKNSSRKNFGNCVLARACRRAFGSQKVFFLRTVAYIELYGPDGKRKIERFWLSPKTRTVLERFDRGEKVLSLSGFTLSPPQGRHRIGADNHTPLHKITDPKRRAREKELILGRRERRRKKLIQGVAIETTEMEGEVRDGTGLVQFIKIRL